MNHTSILYKKNNKNRKPNVPLLSQKQKTGNDLFRNLT